MRLYMCSNILAHKCKRTSANRQHKSLAAKWKALRNKSTKQ